MRGLLLPLTLAALVLTPSALLALPGVSPALPEPGRVGFLLHSRWIEPTSPLDMPALAGWVRGLQPQVVPFGVPLREFLDGDMQPFERTQSWMSLTEGLAVVPSINTFRLPAAMQTRSSLQGLFADIAPMLEGDPDVLVVAGANEPLTRGKAWPSAEAAAERVRMEYDAWHAVSDAPFCHKFTNPRSNVAGAGWEMMEALWASHQDAICYDWYAGAGDTIGTLDRLRDLGQRLGKPVHILEAVVPGNDPAALQAMASRVSSISVYQVLGEPGGEDERLAAYVLQDGAFQVRAPGTMLAQVLQGAPR